MRTVLLWILVLFVLTPVLSAGTEQCRWDTPYFGPLRKPVRDVAVGDGVAVAVGDRFISWSPDGSTWFKADLPFEADLPLEVDLYGVTWTGSEFVAVGGSRFGLLWSKNGVEWEGTIDESHYGYDSGRRADVSGYAGQSILVANGIHGVLLYNDVSSEEYTLIEAPERLDRVVSNGSTIVAAGQEGAWVTHDREHWERIDAVDGGPESGLRPDPDRWDVQWNGHYFVVAGPGGIARSEDGIEWTRAGLEFDDTKELCPNLDPYGSLVETSIPEGSSGDWIIFATTDSNYNEMFFPVAQVCSIRNVFGPEPQASMGEIQWDSRSYRESRIVAGRLADVDFLLGYTGAALRGGQWTKILDPFWLDGPDWIERHGDELASFGSVLLGSYGGSNPMSWSQYEISVSHDLLSWQQRYDSHTGYWRPLHLGDLWLMHTAMWGEDFYEYFENLWSTDLVHFTRESWSEWDDHDAFPEGDFSASSGQRVVVIKPSWFSQPSRFYSSTDLRHWVVSPSDELWRDVTWSGQKFIAVAESGIAGLSDDGEQWTVSTIDPDIELNNVESGGGVTIATGQRRGGDAGFAYISEDDGQHWRCLPSWRGFGVAESGELHWIGDRFLIDTESGVRTSVDGSEWTELSGLPWGGTESIPLYDFQAEPFYGTVWGGLVGGEQTLVRDDGVVFHERCPGQIPFPSAEDRQVLPVTASILGNGGQPWTTEVSVANTTDSWQRLAFSSTDRRRVEEVYLPPRAQTTIGDFNARVLRSRGRLEAIEVASSHDVAVVGTITVPRDDGRLGQEVPPVGSSAMHVGTEPLFIAGLVEDGDFRTNLGISNLGDSELIVVADFLASDGVPVGSLEIAVPAHEVVQRYRVLHQLSEPVPEAASVVLRADDFDARYTAWASVVDNKTSDPCTKQAVPASDGVLVLPAAADVLGASGGHWRTSMDIFNPGGSTARLSLSPLESAGYSGSLRGVELMVPSGSTIHLANVQKDLFNASGSAALRLEVLDGEIVASSRIRQGEDGTVGQGIPAVPVPEQLAPGDRLILAGLHESDDRRTNLGLVNLENFEVRVRLTLWSSVGERGLVRTLGLPPESLTQLNAILAEWPDPRPESGWAEVEILDRPERILAWSSVVDQGTSDPTFHRAQVARRV